MNFTVIIPARFGSTRFPGKPLAEINGKPMLMHVVDRARESGATRIIVATDDERIQHVVDNECEVCMTCSSHTSGTERLAEVIKKLCIEDTEIIINVQGDEPFVPAVNIRQVADNLVAHNPSIATLACPIVEPDEVVNPNCVKVVLAENSNALYFSRAIVPYIRGTNYADKGAIDTAPYLRHIGLYGYTAGYIKQYVGYQPSHLEQIESLEQLRALWYNDVVHVDIAKEAPPVGIDTPEDLKRLLQELQANA
ncbi:3-deoxy-manno-octulosonate cytidylyltransferase [Alteromonas sp. ASW11-130]|uniref:3-deoxy-manno-octulosonate cytidylyltransferase n=1 Tax=Alteromonas sp. ASW11-130 TaxID=3015775 RepID=UPI002242335B|nr:3-deoxy-manno-octulosonate cytidylyltransferase [Alteromonas sp. ASW11-130]MCW8092159.1 3-deoxy-manno-octulosonate cytidylyltransferase [Alteromonas sp. ASW11-130]